MLTVPWWIDRREKKAKGTRSVAGQKRFGLLMESGQRLYNEIANLRGEDLEAWDASLIEWQTSIRTALEEINCPADYPEFVRAADDSEPVAVISAIRDATTKSIGKNYSPVDARKSPRLAHRPSKCQN